MTYPVQAQDVAIPLPGERPVAAAFISPPPVAFGRGVIVIHEAFGLNDDIRAIAARFAAAGYPTLAPDFLDGLGPRPICIARFFGSLGKPGRGRPYRQLAAAQAWLLERAEVGGGPIGLAGFCVGGGFAILYARHSGVSVVAPFYAAVPTAERALEGTCPMVASFGGRDRIFGAGGPRLEVALTESGIDNDVKTYAEAGHSFMSRQTGLAAWLGPRSPLRAGYNEDAAEDAWARTLAFFARYLQPEMRV
jgi:carboxymethylenebutenolidase